MLRKIIPCLLLLLTQRVVGQQKVEWKEGYVLSTTDFEMPPPQNSMRGYQRYYFAGRLDYTYGTNRFEFSIPRNFNKAVSVYFYPSSSWLETGQLTGLLLQEAQLDFNLLELYARRFRKKLYETKGVTYDTKLFQKIYEDLMAEFTKERAEMFGIIDGSETRTQKYNEKVLEGIAQLSEYCKECKPSKNKK